MTNTKLPKTPLACENKTLTLMRGQLAQQRQLVRCVQAVLPTVLAEQVQHCVLKEQKLLVYTYSAAWASQLRFQQQAMLDAVAPLAAITQVQVKVLKLSTDADTQVKRQANIPSLTTIEMLRKDCLSMPDSQVQQAMLSLSATLERLARKNQATRGD